MQQLLKRSVSYLKIHKKAFMILGLFVLTFIVVPQLDAQSSALKISSLNEVENKAKEGADSMKNIAMYVVGAVLAIAIIFVVYAVATNNPHGKDYLLGWVVAVVVYLVALLII